MAPIPSGCAPVSMVYRQKSWDEELVRRVRNIGAAATDSTKCTTIPVAAAEPYDCYQDQEMDGCKTPPKSRQYRVPEESLVCPPAPKKPHLRRRLLPPAGGYFSSPELELFFNQLEISAK